MQRRHLIVGGLAATTLPQLAFAQSLEKPKVTIAVGGKNLFYYLPLTIAEQLGYFKDEGLDVNIVDFAGGARALQAVVGGSADVVSGAFEHTVNMQFKGQPMRAFVLQGLAPQIVLGVNPKTMPNYKSVADLKGKKIGVTAPGSSTNVLANYVLAKAGLKPSDVSFVGVGASNGAVAAMRSGQIDAISNLDPVITLLQRSGDLKIVTDTRIVSPRPRRSSAAPCLPVACMHRPPSPTATPTRPRP
jgi:NitT/TauT family transport system substrate-binding protein